MTSLFLYYYDWAGSFRVDLGNAVVRLGDIDGLTETADNGGIGSGNLNLDDPNANVGYASDGLTGLKFLGLDEMACAVGNRRLYTAMIGDRTYEHSIAEDGSLRLGSARVIVADFQELNSLLNLRLIRQSDTAAKRPKETVGDRLTWILGSTYLSDLIVDGGLVKYPKRPVMDKTDYRQQKALQVIEDCALATGYTAFAYHDDERWTTARLFFDHFLRSSVYASTLRLSNVLSDRDSGVEEGVGATGTFASGPARLTRSPDRVYSGISASYRTGTVFVEDEGIASQFIQRDQVAPNANVKTRTQAQTVARRMLADNDTEYDLISTSVELPPANVNDIRRGHLISGKWSHLPGYTSFSSFRVVSRAITTKTKTDDRYTLDLVLTPANPFTCVGKTDFNQAHGTVTGYAEQVSGTSTWAHSTIPCLIGDCTDYPPDDLISSLTVYNPTNANDGDTATYSVCYQGVLRGTGCVAVVWQSDFDAAYIICSTKGTHSVGSNCWQSRQPDAVEYWDGTAWQPAAGGITLGPVSPLPQYWTFTFATPTETTKLRLLYTYCGVAGPFGLWSWNNLGTRMYDWQILGEAA